MIPPVTQGIIAFMKQQIQPAINVWEIEIPRYDAAGSPISPSSSSLNWPAVECEIEEPGFDRTWNIGTDPYTDKGSVRISVYGTTKEQVHPLMGQIEQLWAPVSNWAQVLFNPSGDPSNGFYIVQMMLGRWWLGQEKDVRVGSSLLLFRGDLIYDPVTIHGAVSTQ